MTPTKDDLEAGRGLATTVPWSQETVDDRAMAIAHALANAREAGRREERQRRAADTYRAPGYYWVRYNNRWSIAHYRIWDDGQLAGWCRFPEEATFSDADFDEIGSRISERPTKI